MMARSSENQSSLSNRWSFLMAWRDARKNYKRLLLFAASMISGIAAVVAIDALNQSLQGDLNRNARELLGADLVANSSKTFTAEQINIFDSTKLEGTNAAEMASMATFENANQSRLVRLNAFGEGYPYYGEVVTRPERVWPKLEEGGYALVDESLAIQFEVSSGDTIKIGNTRFQVAGHVRQFPGGSGILQTFTPSVYIGYKDLDSTGLVQFGSRITFRRFMITKSDNQTALVEKSLGPVLKKSGVNLETVEERKKNLGRAFASVYRFFTLLAFVALMLGCIGVASSVAIYAREKRAEVALLRCLGASGWQAFKIYFIQILVVGSVASLVGALLGLSIQQFVPIVFGDFIPGQVSFEISWLSALKGFLAGILVCILFSALPLLEVRFVPPLSVLRSEESPVKKFSKAKWLIIFLMFLFPSGVASWLTGKISNGIFFTAGMAGALVALWLTAEALLWLVKKYFPINAPFTVRHALSGLFRPNNQTRLLMITLGLGTFIIATLNIVQNSLLSQVEFQGSSNQSNAIMFDIQSGQRKGVGELVSESKFPINQEVPIVTCRLTELRGQSVEKWKQDTTSGIPEWALMREYRVTYRDSLSGSEALLSGKLQQFKPGKPDSVSVTISEGFQETLKAKIGDTLVFDVQGMPVKTVISGIRKVDWPKDPPNFIFVFPSGLLEQAPQIWVISTHLEEGTPSAVFQQKLVTFFPNVSLIDLSLILKTVNSIFEKVGLVVRFLALFSMITGLVVLAGTVVNSRYARQKENILLRTLGAGSRQLTAITLIEYIWLGTFAALTGMVLALSAGFLLCFFFFEVSFSVNLLELWWTYFGVTALTVVIGWLNARGLLHLPPLEVLRREY
ncbi:MAG: ABC transporter permease [Bacteroidetes bacterium]|nr:ABC transporter permease [Bacteroidota bacterium]